MKNIVALAIVAATMLLSVPSKAKDYNTRQVIDSGNFRLTAITLHPGKTRFQVLGVAPMSCLIMRPDISSLAEHGAKFPKGRMLAGQVNVEACDFTVKVREETTVIFLLESEEVFDNVPHEFMVNFSH